jgi:hypothetical protein
VVVIVIVKDSEVADVEEGIVKGEGLEESVHVGDERSDFGGSEFHVDYFKF